MSKPLPRVLLETTDPSTYRTEQVLEAPVMYAVFYEMKPVNIRSVNSLSNQSAAKYRKTNFVSVGHAKNLAEKLNKRFRTDKFQVFELKAGPLAK